MCVHSRSFVLVFGVCRVLRRRNATKSWKRSRLSTPPATSDLASKRRCSASEVSPYCRKYPYGRNIYFSLLVLDLVLFFFLRHSAFRERGTCLRFSLFRRFSTVLFFFVFGFDPALPVLPATLALNIRTTSTEC